jgi:hypothetical protein
MANKNNVSRDRIVITASFSFTMRERHLIWSVLVVSTLVWIMLGAVASVVLIFMLGRSTVSSVSYPLILSGVCLAGIAFLSISRHLSRKDLLHSVVAERGNLEELSESLRKSVEVARQKRIDGGIHDESSN